MKKPLFDIYDRMVIRAYYYDKIFKSKPMVVTQYEAAKAKREFGIAIRNTKLHKIILNILNKPK